MFKTTCLALLVCVLKIDAKFYETDVVPYGHGERYSTHEYDPEVGYPYGLSYRKYPYHHDVIAPKAMGYEYGPEGGVQYPGVGGKLGYGAVGGLEYPGVGSKLGYGAVGGLEYPGVGTKLGYGAVGGLEYTGVGSKLGYGVAGGLEYPGVESKLGYGAAGGLEYPGVGGKLGYGGYYGHGGFAGAPVGITKGIGYGYGTGPISPHGYGLIGHHAPYGVSQIDKGIYSDGKQNIIGQQYNHLQGRNGESLNHGDAGFTTGEVAFKDTKGDSVHFVDADGLKRGHHEGKNYHGGEHFDTEGKHGNEKVLNANHNKGHNIKGFKKSHHLDETGKTEEFFDHDHDQGGNYAFDGRFGKFGEGGGQAYKGGFNDGRFKSGETNKEGHYGNEYFQDKAHANHGKFGENKFAENGEAYGLNKGFGEHGLSGHHDNSNIYKSYPVHGY